MHVLGYHSGCHPKSYNHGRPCLHSQWLGGEEEREAKREEERRERRKYRRKEEEE